MAESMTSKDVLGHLALGESTQTQEEFSTSGVTPASLANVDFKKVFTIVGVTPEQFTESYTSVDFNYGDLCKKFESYCKDFGQALNVASKALEFSAKMIFEMGPYIRNEKKSKGDKAIRFKFPYVKTNDDKTTCLSIKVVIVSTFKETVFKANEVDGKLILTFKQAGMLAMSTFSKAAEYANSKSSKVLMTPLCGAVFSKESINDMSSKLGMTQVEVILMLNESTTAGGQHLPNSDIACAIVAMISSTKRETDKHLRNAMITKVIKQYSHRSFSANNIQRIDLVSITVSHQEMYLFVHAQIKSQN